MVLRYVTREGEGGRVIAVRAKPGCDLLEMLRDAAVREGVRAGAIISGVGMLGEVRLRNVKSFPEHYPITDENRAFLALRRPLEILSLSGNVCEAEGAPAIHVHLVLSYVEGEAVTVVGGHLLPGCAVYGFAEVFMALEEVRMEKGFDEETRTLQLFA